MMANFLLQSIIYFIALATVDSYHLQFRGHHGLQTRSALPNVDFQKITNPTGKSPRSFSVSMNAINVPSALINQVGGPNWWTLTLLAATSSIGIVMEDTKIGAMLSSPLVTMGLGMILCNSGILPPSSPVYSTVMKIFVPLAVPLLLLDADLQKCFTSTGTLLKAFLIGSIGTFLGTIVAYALVPMKSIAGSHKIAAALCARHIGGAVNFVAVSDILQTSPELVAAALAADNVVIAVYFAFLFSLCRPSSEEEIAATAMIPKAPSDVKKSSELSLQTMSVALTWGFLICAVSQSVGTMLSISPMLFASAFAVFAATAFPKAMGTLSAAGGVIGVLAMQMFFAVTGAMGHIPTVLKLAPSVFLHTLIQIAVHFTFSVSVGKFFKLPLREIVLASNANVGGPTTAAAMASSKKWKGLVLPALLTGIFGYAIATGVGLVVAGILPRIRCL